MTDEKPAGPPPHPEPYRTVPRQDTITQWADLGVEVMRFIAARLQADMKLQNDLLRCKTIPELQAVQQDYFAAAIKEYAEEQATLLAKASPFSGHPAGPAHDKTAV